VVGHFRTARDSFPATIPHHHQAFFVMQAGAKEFYVFFVQLTSERAIVGE
jgi:hypothetical protein